MVFTDNSVSAAVVCGNVVRAMSNVYMIPHFAAFVKFICYFLRMRAVIFTVARGPGPRERWRDVIFTVARGPGPRERGMARDRPSPYGKGRRFPRNVARGPVPRECWRTRTMARDRPSPYGEGGGFSPHVARGPVPRDLSTCTKTAHRLRPFPRLNDREGQALALRGPEAALL